MDNVSQGIAFLNPERAVGYLGLAKGMVVADFGAGAGFYTLPAARLVGQDGKVYAIDIQKSALDLIKSKARLENLLNVEAVWADLELPEGSRLPARIVDIVIVSNILFQVDKKLEVMKEAYRVLKPSGKIGVVEWDEVPFPGGPPSEMRVPKRLAQSLLGQAGFLSEKEFEAGSHHYGLLYKK